MGKENNKRPEDQQNEDPAVQRGKAAIEAGKVSDPKPDQEKKKEDEEDAEKWRNEG
jgi:hypothetical protein